MTYRNEITYTVTGSDGTRYENKAVLNRAYRLSQRGAEIVLRREHPTARVTHVAVLTYT